MTASEGSNAPACSSPIAFDELVDYSARDLPPEREAEVEAHVFECGACARRLDSVFELGRAVTRLVERGAVQASVTREVLERAAQAGLMLRKYALAPGDSVACTAAPGDDFVLVELMLGQREATGAARVEVETIDLAAHAAAAQCRVLDVLVDPTQNVVRLLFPGERVRAFPKSRWTLRVMLGDEPMPVQPAYVMNHTPWQELELEPEVTPRRRDE